MWCWIFFPLKINGVCREYSRTVSLSIKKYVAFECYKGKVMKESTKVHRPRTKRAGYICPSSLIASPRAITILNTPVKLGAEWRKKRRSNSTHGPRGRKASPFTASGISWTILCKKRPEMLAHVKVMWRFKISIFKTLVFTNNYLKLLVPMFET